MINLWNWFVKLTGWPPWRLVFRCRRHAPAGGKPWRVKGPVIICCNHTSVWDYADMLMVFFTRTLRCQMAELLFREKGPVLRLFLRMMGGIQVDRGAHDYGFMDRSAQILARGGAVLVFPEGRLPREGETSPLPYQPGAAYLALQTGVPVLPVYTDGRYFSGKRNHLAVGTPIDPAAFRTDGDDVREQVSRLNDAIRGRILELEGWVDANCR